MKKKLFFFFQNIIFIKQLNFCVYFSLSFSLSKVIHVTVSLLHDKIPYKNNINSITKPNLYDVSSSLQSKIDFPGPVNRINSNSKVYTVYSTMKLFNIQNTYRIASNQIYSKSVFWYHPRKDPLN